MKIEPLDLEVGPDMQKLLDMKKWASEQRSKVLSKSLMIPKKYFDQDKI